MNTFDADGYTARLHELAAAYDVPGAVVGVFAEEQTATTATGVLNRLTGVDASTDSLFQIGSITKVWTAALILTLVDDDRLSLTDPVIRHVPELTLVDERSTRELTVGHLLNHTSGLPGDWFPDTGRGDDCLARLVTLLADQPLTHPVGGLTSYSNAAFSVAGHVVERMLDVTWDAALRDRIIKPLGLEHCVTLPEDALLHRTAVGHLDRGSAQQPAPMWQLPRACGPAGLICASVGDVLTFGRLFIAGTTPTVLSPAALTTMTTQTSSLPVAASSAIGFGLGWGLADWHGHRVLAHDGGTIGQAAAIRVLPTDGVVIVLLTNGGDWIDFRDSVLRDVMTEVDGPTPPPPPTPPDELRNYDPAEYVGVYRRPGVDIHVRSTGDGLTLQTAVNDPYERLAVGDETPRPLVATDTDTFLLRQTETRAEWLPVTFLRTAGDAVDYVHASGRAARRHDDCR